MASAADAAQAELASVKEELSAANDASEANVAKITDLEKQLEQKNADLEKSNAEIETIKAEVTEAAEKFKSIEARCEEQMTKTKSLEDEKEALAAQNAELAAKIASNEDQLQVVNVDDDSAKDTRIGELESEIGTLKEQINQAKSKNEEAEKKIAELEATTEKSGDELKSTLAKNQTLNETLIQTDGMLKQLEKDVNAEHEKLH